MSFNPNWHELREQEKYSSLASPKSTFYKTQWVCEGVKLTHLMSIFTSNKVWKLLIKIQLTKFDSKRTKGWKVPCLMPIRVKYAGACTRRTHSVEFLTLALYSTKWSFFEKKYRICTMCWLQVAAGSQECLGSLVTSKTRQFLDLDKIHEFDRNANFWGAKQRIQKITCKASVKFFEFRKVFRVEQTRFYESKVF